MKAVRVTSAGLAAILLVFTSAASGQTNMGTAFTYQGQLKSGGSAVTDTCDFEFGLWDEPSDGNQKASTVTVDAVAVNEGLFTVNLDFGEAFNGQARWLEMAVCCPSGSCTLDTLTPRQELTPAPHALALPGMRTQQNETSPNVIGGSTGNSAAPGVAGATIGGGGDSGGARTGPNSVWDNFCTVAGGNGNEAGSNDGNVTSATCATVGGGEQNKASAAGSTVGGGIQNIASGEVSMVGGGLGNVANGIGSTVGGGGWPLGNTAGPGWNATVAGGAGNLALAIASAVGGGENNSASAYATVPGGRNNTAGGEYSFAAGRRAKVRDAAAVGGGDYDGDEGTFVWADSTDADFQSTGPNQFLIRASGGVGIGTTDPQQALHVGGSGTVLADFVWNGTSTEIFAIGNTGDPLATPTSGTRRGPVAWFGGCNSASPGAIELRYGDAGSASDIGYLNIVQERGNVTMVHVASDGKVGIGRSPTANKLEVEGNASKSAAGDWLANSDARIKTDVMPIENGLETVDRLRPVRFKYAEEYRAKHPSIEDVHYVNFVAQEYRGVFPDSVKNSGENGLLQIDTHPASIYAVAAVQELHEIVKEKDAKIAELEGRLAALEKSVPKHVDSEQKGGVR